MSTVMIQLQHLIKYHSWMFSTCQTLNQGFLFKRKWEGQGENLGWNILFSGTSPQLNSLQSISEYIVGEYSVHLKSWTKVSSKRRVRWFEIQSIFLWLLDLLFVWLFVWLIVCLFCLFTYLLLCNNLAKTN